jgi:hypothetical protein
VLVVGGSFGGTLRSRTEFYRPSSGTWSLGDDLANPSTYQSATLLPDGRVLVVGGSSQGATNLDHVLRFDPVEDTWSEIPSLVIARSMHTATPLLDGRVLVASGSTGSSATDATAELYAGALGLDASWRPELFVIANDLKIGEPATFISSGLLGGTEASSGTTQSSSSGFPLVQLRRLDNEQIASLRPGPEQPFRRPSTGRRRCPPSPTGRSW